MILLIATQIHAHDFAVFHIFNKTAHAVREAFLIYTSGAGALAFGKNHDGFSRFEQARAFIQCILHFFTGSAPVDGNTFGKVTQYRKKHIVFIIISFRQIPGQLPEIDDMLT